MTAPCRTNTLMRSIGTSFASAIAGVVLAQMTTDLGTTALPSENGFKVVMAIGAGAAFLALALAAFLPGRRAAGSATLAARGVRGFDPASPSDLETRRALPGSPLPCGTVDRGALTTGLPGGLCGSW